MSSRARHPASVERHRPALAGGRCRRGWNDREGADGARRAAGPAAS